MNLWKWQFKDRPGPYRGGQWHTNNLIVYPFYNTPAMDQKRFIYMDKDTKQDFYKTLSSNSEILNKPQNELIQPNLKTELNPKNS